MALDAERKMGEMLATASKASGGRPKKTGTLGLPVSDNPTLKDLGISKKESSRAQTLAKVPKEEFEQIKKGDITLRKALRKVTGGNSRTPGTEKLLERVIFRLLEISKSIPETMTDRIFLCIEKILSMLVEKHGYEGLRKNHTKICKQLAAQFGRIADQGCVEQSDNRKEGHISPSAPKNRDHNNRKKDPHHKAIKEKILDETGGEVGSDEHKPAPKNELSTTNKGGAL